MTNKNLYILMFLAMIAWGETWINAKILSLYLSSEELIFWRFLFTSLGLIPVLRYYKISLKISKYNFFLALICGIILAFYNQAFFLGTKYGLASFGGVLVTTLVPIVTFLLVSFMKKKKLTSKEKIGLFIGALGAMIILKIWNFEISNILKGGNTYFFLATIIWPILTILSSYQKEISPIKFSFYMFSLTSMIDFIFLNFHVNNILQFDYKFWANILLLSIYGTTFATTVYFITVAKLGSKSASSFFFIVPTSAIFFSVIFLGENIDAFLIIGGILTIFAVYLINNIKVDFWYNKNKEIS